MTRAGSRGSGGGRGVRLGTVLVLGTLVLTGCGSGSGDGGTARTRPAGGAAGSTGTARLTQGLPASAPADPRAAPPSATEGPSGAEGPDASDTPDPALSDQPLPTLPPGDPGTDGPEGDGAAGDDPPARPPVSEVPAEALLDAATVSAVAGGAWTGRQAATAWCAAPRTLGGLVSRSQQLTAADGRLVQTVSAHRNAASARRAVTRTADRLVRCGWAADRDPRLGEASVQLTRTTTDGTEQVALVLAGDGVGVVLVASGTAAGQGVWESLTDLAQGSACLAAADGCH